MLPLQMPLQIIFPTKSAITALYMTALFDLGITVFALEMFLASLLSCKTLIAVWVPAFIRLFVPIFMEPGAAFSLLPDK